MLERKPLDGFDFFTSLIEVSLCLIVAEITTLLSVDSTMCTAATYGINMIRTIPPNAIKIADVDIRNFMIGNGSFKAVKGTAIKIICK